ncbi:hypothetical protein GCM10010277_87100 [Streptomyces longisporoflavus]|nr:hypothetical protein GCM10010277_87100 [Streptomyces longisporoflavus]
MRRYASSCGTPALSPGLTVAVGGQGTHLPELEGVRGADPYGDGLAVVGDGDRFAGGAWGDAD